MSSKKSYSINNERVEISNRLRDFAHSKCGNERGWQSTFAGMLEIPQGHISPYLRGEKTPGPKLQERLRRLGCDIEWLMTGNTHIDRNEISDEDKLLLKQLYKNNLNTLESLNKFFVRYEYMVRIFSRVDPNNTDQEIEDIYDRILEAKSIDWKREIKRINKNK